MPGVSRLLGNMQQKNEGEWMAVACREQGLRGLGALTTGLFFNMSIDIALTFETVYCVTMVKYELLKR